MNSALNTDKGFLISVPILSPFTLTLASAMQLRIRQGSTLYQTSINKVFHYKSYTHLCGTYHALLWALTKA